MDPMVMYLGDTYIIYRDTCRYGPRSKKGKIFMD